MKCTEEQAIKGGTGTAPTYRNLTTKGLIRKDYLNGDASTGGASLWESRKAAGIWFTDAKLAELTERFGAQPRLTWCDNDVTVDNIKGETRVNRSVLISAAEWPDSPHVGMKRCAWRAGKIVPGTELIERSLCRCWQVAVLAELFDMNSQKNPSFS